MFWKEKIPNHYFWGVQEKFQRHIASVFPQVQGKKLLLACSGGQDSVVLTHLCYRLGLDITLAHCNFQLRGKESDEDEKFVADLAEELKLDYISIRFDTEKEITQNGGSVQMVARKLRYTWFEELLKEKNLDHTLTAHHADDALETFMINLSRGTGMDGLTGIPEINGTTLRPLLIFSKQEISDFAIKEGLNWREDSSNSDTKYLRNKIRKEIVPKLKELHPIFLENFLHTQENLRKSSSVLKGIFSSTRQRLFKEEGEVTKISIEELKRLEPLEGYLYGLFKPFGFKDVSSIKLLMEAESGKELHSETHRILKDRAHLLIQAKKMKREKVFVVRKEDKSLDTPIDLKIEFLVQFESKGKNIAFLDKEKLNYPLTLRKWKKGDYFYPMGMKGKKKVSKFFKDEKIDVFSKEDQWILCSGDDIVWIVGKRIDERFKVEKETTQIIKITYSA